MKDNVIIKKIIDTAISCEINSKNKYNTFKEKINTIKNSGICKYKISDWHLHIVNFNQETEGLERLLEYMDKSNISKSVIFWLPVIKKWDNDERYQPEYYLEDDSPVYYTTKIA